MVEIWKKIPRTKGYYSASSLGRLRSNARKVRYVHRTGKEFWRNKKQRILILHLRLDGYITGYLSIDGKQFGHTVHSLIARTFLGRRPKGFDVCHNNGKRSDNRSENLRYDTRSANHRDKIHHGTMFASCTKAVLTPNDIPKIRKLLTHGRKPADIAKTFAVTRSTIRAIKNRKAWAWIP